ncbi:uncharacterized protein PAN0_007d3314 [Moesziomyces antarcticus]|uniref:Uncharacterized protein n=1 Tax=Pseudozyma antarctica TaxID=84753 RepID=A0A081CEK1_PSEA2|nr:uncharacterized protein PAN0_007d3314 [Moesziomyces antarcticus]GAK65097.1 hypothetical protein PAN0_007d3314 [Moesziomyces antarcticus]
MSRARRTETHSLDKNRQPPDYRPSVEPGQREGAKNDARTDDGGEPVLVDVAPCLSRGAELRHANHARSAPPASTVRQPASVGRHFRQTPSTGGPAYRLASPHPNPSHHIDRAPPSAQHPTLNAQRSALELASRRGSDPPPYTLAELSTRSAAQSCPQITTALAMLTPTRPCD